MKNICIFASSNEPFDSLLKDTTHLCSQFGKYGWNLVWGGSQVGLMGKIADAVRLGGGKLYGVSVERLLHQVRDDIDDLYVAKTISERVDVLIEKADAIVVFPGGTGTIDEMAHAIELKRLGYHQKPIILLNTDGFFNYFLSFSDHVASLGMQTALIENTRVKAHIRDFVTVCTDSESVLSTLLNFGMK